MGFDKNKFLQAKFIPREAEIPVPDMKEFFEEDPENPEFIDGENKYHIIPGKFYTDTVHKKNNLPYYDGDPKKNPDWKPPVWKVRGLTGVEVARSNEAMDKNKNIAAILQGLIAANAQEKVDAVKKLIGIDEKVPNDIAKRIELLILGSIDPAVDTELAVKICRVYPIEFYEITNKILSLTGRGHVPGKRKASGETRKSS